MATTSPEPSQAWRRMLDAIGEAVIATDLAGVVTFWNSAAERCYGWSADEALGANIVDLTPTPTSRVEAKELMARLATGESWTGRFEVQRRDGTTFPARVTNAPLLDGDGRLVGIIGISADLTAQAEIEFRARRGRRDGAVAHLAELALGALSTDALAARALALLTEELELPLALHAEPVAPGRVRLVATTGFPHDPSSDRGVAWPHAPGTAHAREVVLADEDMVEDTPLLATHGVRGGVTVPVGDGTSPALLGVYATGPRTLEPDEIAFVLSIAGVLAGARARVELVDALRTVTAELRARSRRVGAPVADHERRDLLSILRGAAETLRDREGQLDVDLRRRLLDVLVADVDRLVQLADEPTDAGT